MSNVHCRSAPGPGTSGLPYYCALFVCVLNGLGGLAVCSYNKIKKRWPQVCRVKITFTVLPTNRFVSTSTNSRLSTRSGWASTTGARHLAPRWEGRSPVRRGCDPWILLWDCSSIFGKKFLVLKQNSWKYGISKDRILGNMEFQKSGS